MSLPYLTVIEVFASISCAASLAIILTFILFPHLRSKLLVKLVFYISICDFLGNIGYVPPTRPANGTWGCYIESYLNLAAYPSSWWWTLVMIALLYNLAKYGRLPPRALLYAHLISWGVPTVLFLISLGFTKLGKKETFYNYEVCNYYGPLGAEIYHIVTYYGQFFFIVGCLLWMRWKINQLESQKDIRSFQQSFLITKKSLYFYYNIFIITWLPHIILAIINYFVHSEQALEDMSIIYCIATVMKIIHGLITTIVFFARSQEIRELWYEKIYIYVLCKLRCCKRNHDGHGFNSSSTIRGHQEMDIFMQDYSFSSQSSVFGLEEDGITAGGSRNLRIDSHGSILYERSSLFQFTNIRRSITGSSQPSSANGTTAGVNISKPPALTAANLSTSSTPNSSLQGSQDRGISNESWTLPADYGLRNTDDWKDSHEQKRDTPIEPTTEPPSDTIVNALHQSDV